MLSISGGPDPRRRQVVRLQLQAEQRCIVRQIRQHPPGIRDRRNTISSVGVGIAVLVVHLIGRARVRQPDVEHIIRAEGVVNVQAEPREVRYGACCGAACGARARVLGVHRARHLDGVVPEHAEQLPGGRHRGVVMREQADLRVAVERGIGVGANGPR